MNNFNRNSRPGGGNFRGRNSRRRDSGRREMFKAVCDNCGNDCEVPFKPSGGKPIYCSNCFEQMGGGRTNRPSRRGSTRPGFEKRDNTNKQMLELTSSINSKLDRILRVIEPKVIKNKKVEAKKVEKKKAKKKVKKKKSKEINIKKVSKKKIKKSASKD